MSVHHFAEPDPDPDEPQEPSRLAAEFLAELLTTEQLKALPPPTPLVDGLLNLNSLALVYGGSGVGKTHVAIALAKHVALGMWWFGREVTAGPVVYVVAEGVSGTGQRVAAFEQHHQVIGAASQPLYWYPKAVNIFDPGWAGVVAEAVTDLHPSMIVFDTLARCVAGAEENSAKDVGQIVANLDLIRRITGACVLLVHHTGKDALAGARGSSALKGAMDTEIEISGDVDALVIKNTKQKDGPKAAPLRLSLVSVQGTGSVTVTRARGVDPDRLPDSVNATLEALAAIDVPGGVAAGAWKASAELAERTFYRHRKYLLDAEMVTNEGTDSTPRYRPTKTTP